MPKVTRIKLGIPDAQLTSKEAEELNYWTAELPDARPRYGPIQVDDDCRSFQAPLRPRTSMSELAKRVYLVLRELAVHEPPTLRRYDTARSLGISPESLNVQILCLKQLGFISTEKESKTDVIVIRAVPPAPKRYVKRDFRGQNIYLNKFTGIMVMRLPSVAGTSFPEQLDPSVQSYRLSPSEIAPYELSLAERLASLVRSSKETQRLIQLYWRLLAVAEWDDEVEEGEERFHLNSLCARGGGGGRKALFSSSSALRKGLDTLQDARLIYCHHPAMTIAVFPPQNEAALPNRTDWQAACMAAINEWLLGRGLANRVAELVAHYKELRHSCDAECPYEPGLWDTAKQLIVARLETGDFELLELVEFFVEFQYCGEDCNHPAHLKVREIAPATLAGLRDHIYAVYEQVLIGLKLIGADGAILNRFDRSARSLENVPAGYPSTIDKLRVVAEDWKQYLKQRYSAPSGAESIRTTNVDTRTVAA